MNVIHFTIHIRKGRKNRLLNSITWVWTVMESWPDTHTHVYTHTLWSIQPFIHILKSMGNTRDGEGWGCRGMVIICFCLYYKTVDSNENFQTSRNSCKVYKPKSGKKVNRKTSKPIHNRSEMRETLPQKVKKKKKKGSGSDQTMHNRYVDK